MDGVFVELSPVTRPDTAQRDRFMNRYPSTSALRIRLSGLTSLHVYHWVKDHFRP